MVDLVTVNNLIRMLQDSVNYNKEVGNYLVRVGKYTLKDVNTIPDKFEKFSSDVGLAIRDEEEYLYILGD